ncbi:hypothetical protein LEMLEM_LOCUS1152 [Lemmus lemmus]
MCSEVEMCHHRSTSDKELCRQTWKFCKLKAQNYGASSSESTTVPVAVSPYSVKVEGYEVRLSPSDVMASVQLDLEKSGRKIYLFPGANFPSPLPAAIAQPQCPALSLHQAPKALESHAQTMAQPAVASGQVRDNL